MLESVDLDRRLSREEYKERFPPLQERLRQLQYELLAAEIPTVVVFEGWDAAGKGTVIQRLAQRLDPRALRVHPGSPPSEMEQRYQWLWRYQTRLPEDGHIALFDRSWYGRVLVERVEKLAKKKQWRGAYEAIDQFERWLVDDGQLVVKFWFHISRKEQRRRLRRMEADPRERWKVEKEDWRRNERYDDWRVAVEEMLARTHTERCPWTVVASTDARWTRTRVFETLVGRMEAALALRVATPAAVSRSHQAQAATHVERERRQREERTLVEAAAASAGLPVEEA